jgi:hypothetical protein
MSCLTVVYLTTESLHKFPRIFLVSLRRYLPIIKNMPRFRLPNLSGCILPLVLVSIVGGKIWYDITPSKEMQAAWKARDAERVTEVTKHWNLPAGLVLQEDGIYGSREGSEKYLPRYSVFSVPSSALPALRQKSWVRGKLPAEFIQNMPYNVRRQSGAFAWFKTIDLTKNESFVYDTLFLLEMPAYTKSKLEKLYGIKKILWTPQNDCNDSDGNEVGKNKPCASLTREYLNDFILLIFNEKNNTLHCLSKKDYHPLCRP